MAKTSLTVAYSAPLVLATLALTSACLVPPPPNAANKGAASSTQAAGSKSSASTTSSSTSSSSSTDDDANASNVPAVPYTWKSVDIHGGGFVTGVIFSKAKAGILYVRTDVGGAYRYNASDRSWTPLTDFVNRKDGNFMGIESIATDPVKPNRVYMAVGMYAQPWAGPGAFMRSDDQGNTWHITRMSSLKMGGNDIGRSNGERLAVDPHQPKILFFGSRLSGMWTSTDESETWNKLESFPVKQDPKGLGIPFVVFDPSSGKDGEATKVIYAGFTRTDDNLYRSTDAGQTWSLVPNQPKGFLPARAAVDHDGTLYVAYGNDPGPYAVQDGTVYRYEPKGDVWAEITPRRPSEADKFGYGGVAVDPAHPGTVLVTTMDKWSTGAEVYRSLDRGKSWKPIMATAVLEASEAHPYHHREKLDAPQWNGDIEIDPFNSDRALILDGGGVWLSENLSAIDKAKPVRWRFETKNLEEVCVRALISPPEGAPLLSAMADLCGFRHDSLTESPKRGNFRNPTCASADAIDFAGKKPNLMARIGTWPWSNDKDPRGAYSSDGGASWTQFRSEPVGSNGSGSVAISADGAVLVWAAKDAHVARSTDHGVTWVKVQGLPDPQKVPDWAPIGMRLASDRVNPKKFYAYDLQGGAVYVSDDAAAHFTLATRALTSLPEYNLIVGSLQAVPDFEGHLWATGGKELFRSTDAGKSWKTISDVEESYAVGFGKAAPGKKYSAIYLAGKVSGVEGYFRSDDEGAHFVRINDVAHRYGGSNVIIGDPRVYGRVYLGPGGRGIVVGEPK